MKLNIWQFWKGILILGMIFTTVLLVIGRLSVASAWQCFIVLTSALSILIGLQLLATKK